MSRQNKDTKVSKFRLTLVDDQTHKQLWSIRFTRLNFLVSVITVCVCAAAAIYSVIAFTPVRTFIPGYPDAHTKRAAIQNAILADSLEEKMKVWEIYATNLRKVISGEEPMRIDSLISLGRSVSMADTDTDLAQKQDSILREQVKEAEQFGLTGQKDRKLPIEGMHFFTPLKGVISQGYDALVHPYIDITAPANSVVKAALDGTVIFAGWNDEAGYTIQLQHSNDIVTIYKHNQKLLKKTGDKVTAGSPIALVGSTGSLSTGDHLHFELWYKGEAADPTKYINF
ncbi:MAG: M23 family metallopeptidase [Bacteroidetes bacterium]|uniref:M23 family metallopeptidase n=1 Tax=Candidatus Cryptobacteroides faecavium TaxID=2840762 RepID=A0A9D9IEW8_9BACT|nr:M23 family metallopeptidase [Candidatus Cryptobacteroides faecavium]